MLSVGLVATPSGATAIPPTGDGATLPYVHGPLSANIPPTADPSEPQTVGLYDAYGRLVLLHGVNAVYKRPPYRFTVVPGRAWSFTARDAAQIAGMGFNVVRLGILWQGLEPGTAKPNNPAICGRGPAHDPGQWNQATADAYIAQVAKVVDLLGSYHVYSLLDMHQDVYNQAFKGEGAPAWAVCTSGNPISQVSGRWSNNYASKPLNAAFGNFWSNRVAGNLQGEYDRSWAAVARAFASNPWIAGYDPINEPFTTSVKGGNEQIDQELECFYTGTATPGTFLGKPLGCAPTVPKIGVVPAIEDADPHHLLFLEPTIYEVNNAPNFVGSLPYPRLVLNFHAYCGSRSPVTGDPYDESACVNEVEQRFVHRYLQAGSVATRADPASDGSVFQPQGLPLFLTEFGATQSASLVGQVTFTANVNGFGWTYWQWKYYNDPTGSSREALVSPGNVPGPQASALTQTYPMAISGVQLTLINYTATGAMQLQYDADPRVPAPTLVSVPVRAHFRRGYCARVDYGGPIISRPGAPVLEIENPRTARRVDVTVTAGRCR